MPDLNDQFDLSDKATEAPTASEEAEVGDSPENLSFEELREWMLKEGLPELHRIFQEKIDAGAESFGDEATRMAARVEERYDETMSAEEAEELQGFLRQGEELRAGVEADLRAVTEDRLVPNAERLSKHAELRAKRLELDQEWELLSEIVAWENDSEAEMTQFALEEGEDIPSMTDAAKRLNEIYRKIQAIDAEIEALPLEKTEPSSKSGEEAPREDARRRVEPPPPPGSEDRAEWLRAKADAESDPEKKAKWTMKYLEEAHGSTEKPEEGSDKNPILLTEKKKVPTPKEEKKSTPTSEEKADLPDFVDYTRIDEVEEAIARKEAEKGEEMAVQARVDRILSGEETIDWDEVDEGKHPVSKEAVEPTKKRLAPDEKSSQPPEPRVRKKKPMPPKKALPKEPLEHLVTPGADDDVELPLPIEAVNERESDTKPPEPTTDSELQRMREEAISDGLQEEIDEALSADSDAGPTEKPEAAAEPAKEYTTHSERHDANAEIFGRLVTNLDKHLDRLSTRGVDLQTLKKPNQLLKALNKAKIITFEESVAILNDHTRKNTLTLKFKKLMKRRNKKK